ncbi:coiled-coil domain-containing protein 81-like [Rhynchocyon petersi]
MVPNHRDNENLSGQRVSGRVQTCFDEKKDTLLRHRNATPLAGRDVSSIWGKVSEFVERQLLMNKGVQIPGLGIFTFTRQRLQVGNNKFIFLKRPAMPATPGSDDIPVIPLNFTMLSVDLPFTRDIVEGCVRETLLFLSRAISTEQSVEFIFKGIGVLVIRESKVKMRFYKDFLSTVDGSGNLVKALTNRTGTVDSVLSSTEALKKHPPLKNRMARRQNQKNAAYNLSVAEAVRKHKNGKPEYYESYIVPNRPLTAEVNAQKQEEYSQSLLKQIDDQRKQEIVDAQKFKSWQEKAEESWLYKRALDAQIKNKPYQLPVLEPDSSAPIFGRNDDRPKMSTLERQYKFMQHQIEAAANRRKKDTLDKLATQKQDFQMLERTPKE